MKNYLAIIAGVSCTLLLGGAASAASFQQTLDKCLIKNANAKDSATVMLACIANGGKLTSCSVVSDSAPGKGFDKAALCVAEALPMGGKTGEVKVPVRFPGA
ncbi:energy transducer TonB [Phenylobacterium sp.]|jgi:hypothetical protein|uniref:energy transducer TonB family protein n=1 Tax=Phenylobacterium sp. TaxID=1871053 RepID=UPI002F928D92